MTEKKIFRHAEALGKSVCRAESDEGDALLLASEVADCLRVTEKALEHWRRRGTGPQFIRLGRNCVRYRLEDVRAFLASKL